MQNILRDVEPPSGFSRPALRDKVGVNASGECCIERIVFESRGLGSSLFGPLSFTVRGMYEGVRGLP